VVGLQLRKAQASDVAADGEEVAEQECGMPAQESLDEMEESGTGEGAPETEERRARMIDVLESSSGLDLDGDRLVAGEYQVA
jgi:hypothetical protein